MLISSIILTLYANALTMRKDLTIFYSRSTILALLSACIICNNNLYAINLGKGIGLYGGLFNITTITQSFNIFILLISAIILIYNSFYHRTYICNKVSSFQSLLLRKTYYKIISLGDTKIEEYRIIEYSLIILFVVCGAVFLMSSADIISLFISIELQSYGLYILSTLHRDSEQATWGGLTYFLLGGLSSCFILLGSALIYINSGTTSLDGLYIITTISDIIPNNDFTNSLINKVEYCTMNLDNINSDVLENEVFQLYNFDIFESHYISLSLIILSVGFLFKVSAAPFHFWSPDVYDSIPSTVTTFVAIIAKISIFIFLLELVYYINKDNWNSYINFSWKNCLLISSLFSLIIGSILGLTQHRIKRVYAYSTISHVGFILLALSVDSTESIQAYIFYIISYTISNLNAFIILVTIGYTMYLYIYNDYSLEKNLSKDSSNLSSYYSYMLYKDIPDKHNKHYKHLPLPLNDIKNINNKPIINNISNNTGDGDYSVYIKEKLHNEIKDYSIDLYNDKYISYSNTFKNLEGYDNLKDINKSPIQLVNQLKGYFYINPYLAISLSITLFSFIGIPPLIGFFAKQMVLSAALDNGYIFLTLIGILTSVIGATYYLNIVKQIFFFKSDYIINPYLTRTSFNYFGTLKNNTGEYVNLTINDIKINSALSIIISILTLLLLLFIFIPNESFNLAKILTLLLFN